MRSCIKLSLAFALLFASAQLHAGNLWNGTFEDGSTVPWTVLAGSATVGTTSHSGNHGLALGPGTEESIVSQYVGNLTPGQSYVVSAWLLSGGGNSTAELAVGGSNGLAGTPVATAAAWQFISQVYTVGPDGALTVYLAQLPSGNSANIFWDDVSLTPIPPANAGFESGSLAPWQVGQGTAVIGTIAHAGKYALTMEAAGTQVSQNIAGLVPGQTYIVAAWVGATAASGNGVVLSVSGSNPAVNTVANTTTSWQQISATYTTGVDGNLEVSLGQLASGISVAWDDVTITPTGAAGTPIPGVLTYHNDVGRTGANNSEFALTPADVNSSTFGKLFSLPVDGYTLAQPLYVPGQFVAGSGFHNVIVAATEQDSVYLYDADSNQGADASPLWHVNLLDAAHGGISGETPSPAGSCSFGPPYEGVTGTPVIDGNSGVLYVEARSSVNGIGIHRLHAIDMTTGTEEPGWPIVISGSVPGNGDGSVNGKLTFNANVELNRPGLLLSGGAIYVTFGSNGCDADLGDVYHGWIFRYDAATGSSSVISTTPNGVGTTGLPAAGAVWMGGAAPAADAQGNIYMATGNGSFDTTLNSLGMPSQSDYGDSILKIAPASSINISDYFTPIDQLQLNEQDLDLGGGGVVLLPDQPGSYPHLLVEAGKDKTIHLINRDQMNEFCGACTSDEAVQELVDALPGLEFGVPAYWNNNLYYGSSRDSIRAFTLTNGLLSTTPTMISSDTPPNHYGTTPSISSSGATNGILWGIQSWNGPAGHNAVLKAWDANTLASLYASNNATGDDDPGGYVEFTVPTVANGKVYVGTQTGIAVYGLLPGARTPLASDGGFEAGTLGTSWTPQYFNSGTGSATVTAGSAMSGSYSLLEGANSSGEGAYQKIQGLTPGQSYLVSAWIALDQGTTGSAYLSAADTSSAYQCTSAQMLPTSVWQKLSCVYTVPASGALNIGLIETAGSLSSYWDDVSVTPITPANPGFETGTFNAPWMSYFPSGGTGSISVSAGAAESGQYGLLEAPSSAGEVAYQTAQGLVPGQSYLVSAALRLASGSSAATYLTVNDTMGGNACFTPAITPSTAWQQVGCVYTATSNQSMNVQLAETAGTFSTNWDNVAVSPLPPLNGGFESGAFSQPWDSYLPSGGYSTMSVSSAAAHTGNYGLMQGPSAYEEAAYQALQGLTPGQSYVISAWVKLGSGTAGPVFLYAADTQTASSCATTQITPTSTWQQLACTFTAGNSTGVMLFLVRNFGDFTVYWDDAAITPVPPVNGSFESGALAQPWQVTIPSGQSGSITVTAAAAHSGNYGLAEGPNSGGESASQNIFGIPGGASFTVGAWVKLGSGTAGSVTLTADDTTGANQCTSGPITPTGQWQAISCTFTSDATGAIAIHLEESGGNFTTYWDDAIVGGPETPLVWENFVPSNMWVNF